MAKIVNILKTFKDPAYAWHALRRKVDSALVKIRRPWDILYLEVNGQCNLSCTICGRHVTKEKLDYMPMDTYKKISAQVFPRIKNVTMRGLGESLMHKDIIEMVSMAKKRGVEVTITTNGIFLDEKKAKDLILLGLDTLSVSVDGASKESYERVRIGSNFERVISNVKMISEMRKSLGKGNPYIVLAPALMKTNISELPAFVELAHSLGIECVGALNFLSWTEEQDKTLPLYYDDESVFIEHVKKAQNLAGRLGMRLSLPDFRPHSTVCRYSPSKSFIITWKGEVRPCCYLFHSYSSVFAGIKKDLPPVIFGDINREKFRDIWKKPEYREFRSKVAINDFPDVCQNCLSTKGL